MMMGRRIFPAIIAGFIAVGFLPPSQASPWQPFENVDPITDARTVGATATGDDGGSLVVRCLDKVEVYFRPGRFIYLGDGRRPVVFRFDNAPPVEEEWSVSLKGSAVFAEHPRRFFARSIRTAKVVIRVADYRGVEYTRTFNLKGFAASTKAVMDCDKRYLEREREREREAARWRKIEREMRESEAAKRSPRRKFHGIESRELPPP